MKKIIIPALVAVALAGCQFVPGTEAHMVASAKKAVAGTLKDPSSPMFTNIKVVEDGVCGRVNGKNSFGAYAGAQGFVWRGTETLMENAEHSNPGVTASNRCQYEALRKACAAGEPLINASINSSRECSAVAKAAIEEHYSAKFR